jgi:aldehyde dehydrogenase (NAD+)
VKQLKRYLTYIDGKVVEPSSKKWFETVNPFTQLPWALIPRCDAHDVDLAIGAADRAFRESGWADLRPSKRGAVLRRIGDVFATKVKQLAEVETRDLGKPIADTLAQIGYLPEWFYYYGGLIDKIEGRVIPIDQEQTFNYTKYESLGVVAAITPWNSPLMLTCWKLAPLLAAGNTVVIKPSNHASASIIEFMDVFEEAEVPPGVVNLVTGHAREIGQTLVEDPRVAKISFTGSTEAGIKIGQQAAANCKRVALELGGKSAQIICEDASIDKAVNGVISGIFYLNGQSCVAGSRLLLHDSIRDTFLKRLIEKIGRLKYGDPSDYETQIGPVSNEPQFKKVLDYIDIGKTEGADCLHGGTRSTREGCENGWFIEPTIFTNVNSSMRIACEEIFGPVLAVMPFSEDEEAIRIANDIDYGLAAGVWTSDLRRAHAIADRLECGTVYVNQYKNVSFLSPAGGYKRSGIGRENGPEMIKEYLQVKSVWINTG